MLQTTVTIRTKGFVREKRQKAQNKEVNYGSTTQSHGNER